MSKHSIHLRLETLKGWLEQTRKNNKYGRPKVRTEVVQEAQMGTVKRNNPNRRRK
jgi:hypothetical protein